jgi:two-component system response regulator RegA
MRADAQRGVIVVDDDERFAVTLAMALARRGYVTHVAHNAASALATARTKEPDAAVVDLKLGADDGLALTEALRRAHPQMRIVVLTGYASIATAVKAIKLGADDYLAKPVTASAVAAVLERGDRNVPKENDSQATPLEPMSPRRLEWEHLQRVLAEHDGNISETARVLRMHRRTLQRKLAKHPTRS